MYKDSRIAMTASYKVLNAYVYTTKTLLSVSEREFSIPIPCMNQCMYLKLVFISALGKEQHFFYFLKLLVKHNF